MSTITITLFLFHMFRRHPCPPLFPYTTLFRSLYSERGCRKMSSYTWTHVLYQHHNCRSEEHTSELQSRGYLVCRLLLEKKKKSLNVVKELKPAKLHVALCIAKYN